MWSCMLAVIVFAPGFQLTFLSAYRSKIAPAFVVALAYFVFALLTRSTRRHARRGFDLFKSAMISLGLYLALHIAICTAAHSYVAALKELQWLLYFVASAWMTINFASVTASRLRAERMLAWILLVEASVGIVTSFTGPLYDTGSVLWVTSRWGLGLLRATGTVGSANGFGGLVACGAAWLIFWPGRMRALRRWSGVMLCVVAVFASQSKSAMLSLVISISIVAAFRLLWAQQTKRTRIVRAGVIVAVLLLGAAALISFREPIMAELNDDMDGRSVFTSNAFNAYRTYDYDKVLLGVGLSNAGYIDAQNGVWMTAHNSYVTILSELGLIGAIIIVGILAGSLVLAIRSQMWHILALLIVIALHALTEQFLLGAVFVILLAWSAALVSRQPARLEAISKRRLTYDLPARWTQTARASR